MSMNLALALVLGLMAGAGLALLLEMLDDTIKTGAELEKLVDKPVLGIIPKVPDKDVAAGDSFALYAYEQPTSAFAEAYRSMRTALMFSTADGAPKIMGFTSSRAGEGKTTTAVSMATNFTQTGSAVLIIDADLRNPSLHKVFSVSNEKGLSNYLSGTAKPAEITHATGVNNLFVMPSGPVPPNPAELLAGGKMVDLATLGAKRFDHVILDCPPLMGLADALILSDIAQAILLVVSAKNTRTGALADSVKRLRHTRANVLGTVLTSVDMNAGAGYGYDYQYSYDYGAGADPDTDFGDAQEPTDADAANDWRSRQA